jgi:quinolinate synthase
MLWQLQNAVSRHRYHPVPGVTCACNKCPHMARNTLEKLRDCLATGRPEVTWQPEFETAAKVLRRSLLE